MFVTMETLQGELAMKNTNICYQYILTYSERWGEDGTLVLFAGMGPIGEGSFGPRFMKSGDIPSKSLKRERIMILSQQKIRLKTHAN